MTANSPAASYRFVFEPSDALKCLICLEVAEEPWQHGKCGRLFCEKCLEKHGKEKPCRACQDTPEYFKDNRGKREINALSVICGNNGCSEVMNLEHIEDHTGVCEHALISCKYISIGCKEELKRKDMAAHEEDGNAHLQIALEKINLEQEKGLNGKPIKFTLTDFGKQKDKNDVVNSPSYYIYPNSYHMALRVEPNGFGDGEGTHVSVYSPILKGRHDAKLKWPFVGRITFILLNQLEDKNHRQGRIDFVESYNACAGGMAWGLDQFIPHSELGHDPVKNTQYLKDDTLYFRMEVEVADRKPWLE